MTLEIGSVLNSRYRIARLVGQGGFGAVYRAWDLALSQPVALKENVDSGSESQRQFEQEAKLLAGLRHPNLPRVIDHFILTDQGQYLVMDFIEGRSLAQMLRDRRGPLDEAEAQQWLHQICDAVEYLHTRTPPIIHRDIKPDNIIVTAEGRAMLVDFGISKLYDAQRGTTVGARAVTPGYSPPEQYGFGKTDARSDVYALGATLYTLLTGQPPPEAIDLISGTEVLTPVQQVNPAVSGAAAQAIVAAMMPSISQRLASAARFEQALTGRVAPPVPAPAPQPRPAPPRPDRPPAPAPSAPARPRQRQGCMLGGVAIAALVVGAIAMLVLILWLFARLGASSTVDFTPTITPFAAATPEAISLSGSYVGVTNNSGALSADAPVEWVEIDGSNWLDSAGNPLGARITVAPNINALRSSYGAPGVDILASVLLSNGSLAELDNYKTLYSTACTYDGRSDISFAAYTGAYDAYSGCGGGQGNVYVAAGTAADGSHIVVFQCQYITQADLEACNHMLNSVAVAGALPQ